MELTQKNLKRLFYYNKCNGKFTRLITTQHNAKKGDVAGSVGSCGYLKITLCDKTQLLHRLAFLYMTGFIPDQVDHINHIRTDNRWANLRSATAAINSKNQSIKKNNTSGITGVRWEKDRKRWTVRLCVNGNVLVLGRHKSKETAITIRKAAECWFGFHPNHGKAS